MTPADDRWIGTFRDSLFAVLDQQGVPAGVAFLVPGGVLFTCAHVIDDVRGGKHRSEEVQLRQSLLLPDSVHEYRAVIVSIERGKVDIAVLRFTEEVLHVRPVRLIEASDLWNHPVRTFGFPRERDAGIWHEGVLRGRQSEGRLQVDALSTGYRIEPGFSGAPVWDAELAGVVGMVVAADLGATRAASVIPTELLIQAWPDLSQELRLPSPYRGLLAYREADAALFFGRDTATGELVNLLGNAPVLIVIGASGSGKSSLLRAGVVPKVRARGSEVIMVRATGDGSPFAAVAGALLHVGKPDSPPATQELRTLEADLSTRGLADHIPVVLAASNKDELVIVIDQAEQLLQLPPPTITAFLGVLLPDRPPDRLRVVMVFRADHLEAALAHERLATALRRYKTFFLAAMTRDELFLAVIGPVELSSVRFEPGLAARIVDDAGDDAGVLPLLSNALTIMWQHQEHGLLTNQAYDELGGVKGSLAQYANDVWSSLSPEEQRAAEEALLSMVMLSADGRRATRRARTATQLGVAGWNVSQRLVAARLLVASNDEGTPKDVIDGRPTVEIAHDALLERWPLFAEWIGGDRKFLNWRTQLDLRYEAWKASGNDKEALLRGLALDTAADYSNERTTNIDPALLSFVRLSLVRRRWEMRRWQVITAILGALVVVAGGLSVVAYDRNNQLNQQLRSANAEILGRDSLNRAVDDPVFATQLALVAWRSGPDNVTARNALARQYMAMRSVNRVQADVSDQVISQVTTSDDGQTIVSFGTDGAVTVSDESNDADQMRWNVPGIPRPSQVSVSPDGRWLATDGSETGIVIWDIALEQGPIQLSGNESLIDDVAGPVTFSPDGNRLVTTVSTTTGAHLDVWNMTNRERVAEVDIAIDGSQLSRAWLTTDPDRVLVRLLRTEPTGEQSTTLNVYSLSDGALVRRIPGGASVVRNGLATARCLDNDESLSLGVPRYLVLEDTSREVETVRLPLNGAQACSLSSLWLTTDGNHVVERTRFSADLGTAGTTARITSLSTGNVFDFIMPPRRDESSNLLGIVGFDSTISAFDEADGTIRIVMSRDTSLLFVDNPTRNWIGDRNLTRPIYGTTDGRFIVHDRPGSLAVLDRASGVVLGSLLDDAVEGATEVQTLPRDGRDIGVVRPSPNITDTLQLAVKTDVGWRVTTYSLPDLQTRSSILVPGPRDPRLSDNFISQQVDSQLVALSGGVLSVTNVSTGAAVVDPIVLGESVAEQQEYRTTGNFIIRPGNLDEVVIPSADGTLIRWSLTGRRQMGSISTHVDATKPNGVIFDPSGSRIVTLSAQHSLEVWNADSGELVRPGIPAPNAESLLAFTVDGYLMTTSLYPNIVEFWSLEQGTSSGTLTPDQEVGQPVGEPAADKILVNGLGLMPTALPVVGQTWFEQLCVGMRRPFTNAEESALPQGISRESPCSAL